MREQSFKAPEWRISRDVRLKKEKFDSKLLKLDCFNLHHRILILCKKTWNRKSSGHLSFRDHGRTQPFTLRRAKCQKYMAGNENHLHEENMLFLDLDHVQ